VSVLLLPPVELARRSQPALLPPAALQLVQMAQQAQRRCLMFSATLAVQVAALMQAEQAAPEVVAPFLLARILVGQVAVAVVQQLEVTEAPVASAAQDIARLFRTSDKTK
jgi:xanthosine utilization system XapX-like protein